jgi:hypothetical protein
MNKYQPLEFVLEASPGARLVHSVATFLFDFLIKSGIERHQRCVLFEADERGRMDLSGWCFARNPSRSPWKGHRLTRRSRVRETAFGEGPSTEEVAM